MRLAIKLEYDKMNLTKLVGIGCGIKSITYTKTFIFYPVYNVDNKLTMLHTVYIGVN